MNTIDLIKQLRATSEALRPLTQSVSANAKTWDGTSYVKGQSRSADPTALVWWTVLNTIADLIEAQESPATPRQVAYLKRALFGGMGSLNDVSFSVPRIDELMEQNRRMLFDTLQE
jgi:hypothetical protein